MLCPLASQNLAGKYLALLTISGNHDEEKATAPGASAQLRPGALAQLRDRKGSPSPRHGTPGHHAISRLIIVIASDRHSAQHLRAPGTPAGGVRWPGAIRSLDHLDTLFSEGREVSQSMDEKKRKAKIDWVLPELKIGDD